ncbi:MAG: hypothetical protein ACXAAN_14255 [Candidatus Thorarchaeota archaeon]|jgi:hypothetical protein
MNQRLVAVGLVVVIVFSVSAYFIIFPTTTSFQYQRDSTADNQDYIVGIYNIRDCEVNVSFTVSSTVFYLHEDSYRSLLNYYEGSSLTAWSREEVRVKKLDLVLGTGKAYKIAVWGTNLTTTVTYSNGALIGQDSYFQYRSDNGSIFVEFNGDEVDDSTLGSSSDPVRHDFDLGRQDFDDLQLTYAELDIDLPYFYYGDLDVIAAIIDVSITGWSRGPMPEVFSYYTNYVQGEGDPPNVYIDVFSVEVVADLVKATSP